MEDNLRSDDESQKEPSNRVSVEDQGPPPHDVKSAEDRSETASSLSADEIESIDKERSSLRASYEGDGAFDLSFHSETATPGSTDETETTDKIRRSLRASYDGDGSFDLSIHDD
jgi:hypothetical protein